MYREDSLTIIDQDVALSLTEVNWSDLARKLSLDEVDEIIGRLRKWDYSITTRSYRRDVIMMRINLFAGLGAFCIAMFALTWPANVVFATLGVISFGLGSHTLFSSEMTTRTKLNRAIDILTEVHTERRTREFLKTHGILRP